MSCGSLFQAAGPEYEKACSLNFVRSLGRQQFIVFPYRKPGRVAAAATVLTRSLMYFGAWPQFNFIHQYALFCTACHKVTDNVTDVAAQREHWMVAECTSRCGLNYGRPM